MKTLLSFTPRLVAIVLLVLLCSSLMANTTSIQKTAERQTTLQVVAEFAVLLLFILLPLFIRRSAHAIKSK